MYHVTRVLWALTIAPFRPIAVSGRENIPQRGAFIVVADHTSNCDPWIIVHALGLGRRPIRWLAGVSLYGIETAAKTIELGKSRSAAFLAGLIGSFVVKHALTIPVEREEDKGKKFSTVNKQAFKEIKKILSTTDGVIGVFPEGGIGRNGNLHTSFVWMAQRFNVPILYVRFVGKDVIIGKPIIPNGKLTGRKRTEEAHRIMGRLYNKETP